MFVSFNFSVSCLTWRFGDSCTEHELPFWKFRWFFLALVTIAVFSFNVDWRIFLTTAVFKPGWNGWLFPFTVFCCSTLELAYEFKNSFLFPRVQNMGDSMPLTIVATNQMDEQIHRVSIYIQQWQKEILINPNRSCEGKGTEAVIWFAVFSMFFGFRRLW